MAGADNVATVIPDNYPLNVKGVDLQDMEI